MTTLASVMLATYIAYSEYSRHGGGSNDVKSIVHSPRQSIYWNHLTCCRLTPNDQRLCGLSR